MTDRDKEMNEILTLLKASGLSVRTDAPFGSTTTYRVGGLARFEVTISSDDELVALSTALSSHAWMPLVVCGNGSNMLVADVGFRGVVVRLSNRYAYETISDEGVEIGGAISLPVVARRIASSGLTGFEWAVGVPGTIGGAVRMNAGGHGSDISASITGVETFDISKPSSGVRFIRAVDLGFGYRTSGVNSAEVVLRAFFRFGHGDRGTSLDRISRIVTWRRENQPGGQNAGSVFVNPPGISAGQLIEDCGLKGLIYRSACVSSKHANFIQSKPSGSSRDVFELMGIIRDKVQAFSGVRLRTEIRLIGFGDDLDLLNSDDY